jgi:hypothetical protein
VDPPRPRGPASDAPGQSGVGCGTRWAIRVLPAGAVADRHRGGRGSDGEEEEPPEGDDGDTGADEEEWGGFRQREDGRDCDHHTPYEGHEQRDTSRERWSAPPSSLPLQSSCLTTTRLGIRCWNKR